MAPFGKRPFKGPVTLLINVNNFSGFLDMILQVGKTCSKLQIEDTEIELMDVIVAPYCGLWNRIYLSV